MNTYYSQTNTFSLDSRVALTSFDRGNNWLSKGEVNKAIAEFSEAIRRDATFVPAYFSRGDAWLRIAEYDKAIADFDEVLRHKPRDANCFFKRGFAWLQTGDFDKAIADLDESTQLAPSFADAYGARGDAWLQKGMRDKAIRDLNEAVRLMADESREFLKRADLEFDDAPHGPPRASHAYNLLATILGASPDASERDGKRALELATNACEMSGWKDPRFVSTLAIASAECGDFENAVKRQLTAIELSPDDDELKVNLELFRSGKPCRLVMARNVQQSAESKTQTSAL
jgi:tetratricopeptide (TPR) repeat protein